MQVLEWAIMFPHRVRSILPLATCASASALQIAWSAVERLAIATDPGWYDGDYYDKPEGPWMGLATARQIAQITYRSGESFERRFGRQMFDPAVDFDLWGRFQMESYLDHTARNWSAASTPIPMWCSTGRWTCTTSGGAGAARPRRWAASGCRCLPRRSPATVSTRRTSSRNCTTGSSPAADCRRVILHSDEGHDGFLLEHELLRDPVVDFLDEVSGA